MRIYVISGGPGTGKTSVINELEKEFKILKEPAREVGNTDLRFKGKSVKETDLLEFQDAIFEFQKKHLKKLKEKNGIIFSDRGLGDTITYYKMHKLRIPEEAEKYAQKFRYSGIFVLDPLNFYKKDSFRRENKQEQKKIHNLIIKTYNDLGYKIIFVPFMPVEERVNFIKNRL
jgi:predicted ATPase